MLSVSDDGQGDSGKDAGNGTREGHGIGLANVHDRLAARFGDEATIVSGTVPGGYATQLRMPILRENDEG